MEDLKKAINNSIVLYEKCTKKAIKNKNYSACASYQIRIRECLGILNIISEIESAHLPICVKDDVFLM